MPKILRPLVDWSRSPPCSEKQKRTMDAVLVGVRRLLFAVDPDRRDWILIGSGESWFDFAPHVSIECPAGGGLTGRLRILPAPPTPADRLVEKDDAEWLKEPFWMDPLGWADSHGLTQQVLDRGGTSV